MDPLRSMLFTPGHRHDLIQKATTSGTDAVIVDLEDAVASEEKANARAGLSDLPASPVPLFVRTNGPETEEFWADIVACGQVGVAGVVIPKAEHAHQLVAVDGALTALELANGHKVESIAVIPLIESALGSRNTYDMMKLGGRFETLMFGGGEQGDLVADLGCEWTPEGTGLLFARSKVLHEARAAGVAFPMEAVFMDFRNLDALRTEAELARRLGYTGKVAIHPAQIPVINDVFTPAPDVVAHNRRIIAEFDKALADGVASIAVDGKMVDYAVARVARTIIARAEVAEKAAARTS